MRKELASAVRAEFAVAIKRRLPQFNPIKVASRFAWPGSRVFRWTHDASLHFFVELLFDPKGADAFAVEVGWSRLGRYPEVRARPGFPSGGGEATRPEHWSRLSSLYAPIGGFWGEARLALPEGEFEDVLTGARHRGGARPMKELLAEFPVALLVHK